MQAAALFDCFAFDDLPLFEYGRCSAEVDVSRRQVVRAFVISAIVVVLDELADVVFELAWQVVALQQDPVDPDAHCHGNARRFNRARSQNRKFLENNAHGTTRAAPRCAKCASESDLRVVSAPNTPHFRIRPNHIRHRIRPNNWVRRPPVALCRPELASR
jgi:hypothetical protein